METFKTIVWPRRRISQVYLKVKEILQELGLKTIPGDDAFYYENRNGKLMGMNLSHVDDFTIAGDI